MKIIFLGTRGYIDITSKLHARHASTLICYKGKRVMIDCGIDWQKKVFTLKPDAIILTHAHPDHAWGLKDGAPCPVYATKESWDVIQKYPIQERVIIDAGQKIPIHGMTFEVFDVIHSIRAPAVGYRITAGRVSIFCAHDLIYIHNRHKALQGIQLYIGDGATLTRPMVRRKGDQLFGHTTIRAQLGWCQKEGVPRAIFTHCGSQIVKADKTYIEKKVAQLGVERSVVATIAHDGMTLILR